METLLAQIVESFFGELAHGLRAGVLAGPAILAVVLIGARGLSPGGRAIFAAVLALTVCPALAMLLPPAAQSLGLLQLATSGLVAAVAIASALAAAHMAGVVALETLAGSARPGRFNGSPRRLPGLGPLMNLAALLGFLHLGGPSSLTRTLRASTPWLGAEAGRDAMADWGVRLATHLVGAMAVAVAVAAPLLAARLLISIFEGLWLRVTHPAAEAPGLQGLRELAQVVLVALLLERMLAQLLNQLARSL